MKTNSKSEATILCEKALENIFAENAEMNILPKTNDIITRMLKHQLSLEEVYEEISEKLGGIARNDTGLLRDLFANSQALQSK